MVVVVVAVEAVVEVVVEVEVAIMQFQHVCLDKHSVNCQIQWWLS